MEQSGAVDLHWHELARTPRHHGPLTVTFALDLASRGALNDQKLYRFKEAITYSDLAGQAMCDH